MVHSLRTIAASLVVLAAGCNSVTLDSPLGDPLSSSQKAAYVGRWMNDESQVCEIRLGKDQNLVLGLMTWDEKSRSFELKSQAMDARVVGRNTYFLSQDEPSQYGFMRVERKSESVLKIYLPDPAKFRDAVEAGKLDGEVITGDDNTFSVKINSESPLTVRYFSGEDSSTSYIVNETTTLRRIASFDDAQ